MARRIRTSALTARLAGATPLVALALLVLPLQANTKELPYPTLDELREILVSKARAQRGKDVRGRKKEEHRRATNSAANHPIS